MRCWEGRLCLRLDDGLSGEGDRRPWLGVQ